jgi:hypothetical protein
MLLHLVHMDKLFESQVVPPPAAAKTLQPTCCLLQQPAKLDKHPGSDVTLAIHQLASQSAGW